MNWFQQNRLLGTFLAGLRDRRILGVRGSDGRVLVPPTDYDPVTSETLNRDAMVERNWASVNCSRRTSTPQITMRLLGRSMRSQATSTLDMLSFFFSAMADAVCG